MNLVRPLPNGQGTAALLGDIMAPYDDEGAFAGRIRVAVPRVGVGETARSGGCFEASDVFGPQTIHAHQYSGLGLVRCRPFVRWFWYGSIVSRVGVCLEAILRVQSTSRMPSITSEIV
jgi:hypothetical protein